VDVAAGGTGTGRVDGAELVALPHPATATASTTTACTTALLTTSHLPAPLPVWNGDGRCGRGRSPVGPAEGLVGTAGAAGYRWLKPPDSSAVMATETGCRSKWPMASLMSFISRKARSRLTPWRTRIRWMEMSDTDPVSG